MLPLEVLLYVLEVGAFTHRQLAPLRLVNRALCVAASDPSHYREHACWSAAALETFPPFVATSLHRLVVRGNGEINIRDVSGRMPNLTSLDCRHGRLVADGMACRLALRELRLKVKDDPDADFVGRLTNLECLEVARVGHMAPIVPLRLLQRLSLPGSRTDTGELLSALASAPCAGTLEALRLEVRTEETVLPRWLVPLLDLCSLREFALAWHPKGGLSAEHVDAFAGVVANLPTLAVLSMFVPEILSEAVILRGFSSDLRVLGLFTWIPISSDALAALPPGLAA